MITKVRKDSRVRCPFCGYLVGGDWKYCPSCGVYVRWLIEDPNAQLDNTREILEKQARKEAERRREERKFYLKFTVIQFASFFLGSLVGKLLKLL